MLHIGSEGLDRAGLKCI